MNPRFIERDSGYQYFLWVCTAQDREITGFDAISRGLIGRNRDIDIFTTSVWMGSGYIQICTGSVWTGAGFQFLQRIAESSRVPWNPAGKSRGKIPRTALTTTMCYADTGLISTFIWCQVLVLRIIRFFVRHLTVSSACFSCLSLYLVYVKTMFYLFNTRSIHVSCCTWWSCLLSEVHNVIADIKM